MKKDAFDDLDYWPRFGYKKQLREARAALDAKVYNYVLRFPNLDYRAIAKRLRISPAKLCAIMRQFNHGRRPGRRKRKEMPPGNARVAVRPPAAPVSHYVELEDVELALKALDRCITEGQPTDSGEDSYRNLTHWLETRRGSRAQITRAKYLTRRYENLRD